MIRNLKVLGLAVMAAFALSAVGASGASANPALFTAETIGAGEFAHVDGGQTGTDTFTLEEKAVLTCETATLTGEANTAGPQSTYVTLEPTYNVCHAIRLGVTRTATVTMNACVYKFNATKETAETPFSADLTIECSEEGLGQIEIHVYNDNAVEHNEEVLCTYDIAPQTVNNAIQLKNEGNQVIAHVNANIALTNTKPGFICTTASTAVYKGEDTLKATNKEGKYVNTSVS